MSPGDSPRVRKMPVQNLQKVFSHGATARHPGAKDIRTPQDGKVRRRRWTKEVLSKQLASKRSDGMDAPHDLVNRVSLWKIFHKNPTSEKSSQMSPRPLGADLGITRPVEIYSSRREPLKSALTASNGHPKIRKIFRIDGVVVQATQCEL